MNNDVRDISLSDTRRQLGLATKPLAVSLVVLACLAVAAVFLAPRFFGGQATATVGQQTPQWAEARVEAIPITVVAQGDLIAKDQLDIINLIDHPDDERLDYVVEEGTWVEEGDLLYTLNAPGLVADRDEWISRVRTAEAELEEARRNLEIEKDTAAGAEAKARLELELARLSHEQWEMAEYVQEINDLNLAVEKAGRELEIAKRELAYSQELHAEKFISDSELEQDVIREIEAVNGIRTAKLKLESYLKYEKVKAEKEKLSDIKQAEEELERTIRKNENKLQLLEAKIESERNELDQRRTKLADLERMVGAMEVKAPRSGMVIYSSTIGVNRWERSVTIRSGARIWGGHRVMVLSNTSQMVANLYVHESRINEIEPGQNVSIIVNARPGEVYQARVTSKKNSAVQSGSNNPHLRQYQVFAELPPNLGEGIRPGMNCSAEIYIRQIPEALSVPIQAVHTEGEGHFVYVEADERGKVRRQSIELGGSSDTLVQIKAGLDAGSRVLLRNPQPGELLREEALPEPLAQDDSPSTISARNASGN